MGREQKKTPLLFFIEKWNDDIVNAISAEVEAVF
jgi:hypothetical protein